MNPKKEVDPYTIKSSTDEFTSKAKNVFDCLQNLEDKHKAYEKARKSSTNSSDEESDQNIIKEDPSKEEFDTIKPAFKKPVPVQKGNGRSFRSRRPYKRGGRMPDFNDGPVKWKKYSLEDVDELNDASNRQAAYAFLEERRKLREGEIMETKADVQSNACSKGQFTFKKRSKDNTQTEASSSKDGSDVTKNSKTLDLIENDLDANEGNVEEKLEDTPVVAPVFKSRKSAKRSIRSRETKPDDEETEDT